MFSLLRRLQKQPEAYRRQIAFWISGGFVGILFIVWAVTFTRDVDETVREQARGTHQSATATEEQVDYRESFNQIVDSFSTVSKSFGAVTDALIDESTSATSSTTQ